MPSPWLSPATLLVGTSPALAIAIVTESRAKGPLATVGTELVVLLELATALLFLVCLEGSRVVFGLSTAAALAIGAVWWLLSGRTAFGAVLGGLFALYLRYVGREVTVMLLGLCAALSGFAEPLGFEPFLAGLAAGVSSSRKRDGASRRCVCARRD